MITIFTLDENQMRSIKNSMIAILRNDQQFFLLTSYFLHHHRCFHFHCHCRLAEDGVDDEGNMIVLIK